MTDRPQLAGVHHFSPTVTDVEASAEWHQRVLGLKRGPPKFPHHGSEDSGFAVVLADMAAGVMIGLHHHTGNHGGACDERRTGIDHIAFGVPARADLDTWAAWLDEQGVTRPDALLGPDLPRPRRHAARADVDGRPRVTLCAAIVAMATIAAHDPGAPVHSLSPTSVARPPIRCRSTRNRIRGSAVNSRPGSTPAAERPLTVDEVSAGATPLRTSADLASLALFDDDEVDEFLADLQKMRQSNRS